MMTNNELTKKFENRMAKNKGGRKSEFTAEEHAEAVRRAFEAGWDKMNTVQRREFVDKMRFNHGGQEIRIGLSTLASWIDMIREEDPQDSKHFSEQDLLAAIARRELGDAGQSREALMEALGKAERKNLSSQEVDRAVGLYVAERMRAKDTGDLQVLLGRKIADQMLGGNFHRH